MYIFSSTQYNISHYIWFQVHTFQDCHFPFYQKIAVKDPTCSGLSPGGTHVYSSKAHPLSSSDVELRCCASCVRRCRLRSPSLLISTSWHSRGHLQCRHIFLQIDQWTTWFNFKEENRRHCTCFTILHCKLSVRWKYGDFMASESLKMFSTLFLYQSIYKRQS